MTKGGKHNCARHHNTSSNQTWEKARERHYSCGKKKGVQIVKLKTPKKSHSSDSKQTSETLLEIKHRWKSVARWNNPPHKKRVRGRRKQGGEGRAGWGGGD